MVLLPLEKFLKPSENKVSREKHTIFTLHVLGGLFSKLKFSKLKKIQKAHRSHQALKGLRPQEAAQAFKNKSWNDITQMKRKETKSTGRSNDVSGIRAATEDKGFRRAEKEATTEGTASSF